MDKAHHNLQTGLVSVTRHGSRRITDTVEWAEVTDAAPHVSAAQWRTSRTKGAGGKPKRSVHAWIRGTVSAMGDTAPDVSALRRITYNPSRHAPGAVPVFRYADTGEEWTGSARVIVSAGYAWEVSR